MQYGGASEELLVIVGRELLLGIVGKPDAVLPLDFVEMDEVEGLLDGIPPLDVEGEAGTDLDEELLLPAHGLDDPTSFF